METETFLKGYLYAAISSHNLIKRDLTPISAQNPRHVAYRQALSKLYKTF